MKPTHRLMLRKVGKGSMFDKAKMIKGEMKTMEVKSEDIPIASLTDKMNGLGITKVKRKPLKLKL
jgi:hypothetical protein